MQDGLLVRLETRRWNGVDNMKPNAVKPSLTRAASSCRPRSISHTLRLKLRPAWVAQLGLAIYLLATGPRGADTDRTLWMMATLAGLTAPWGGLRRSGLQYELAALGPGLLLLFGSGACRDALPAHHLLGLVVLCPVASTLYGYTLGWAMAALPFTARQQKQAVLGVQVLAVVWSGAWLLLGVGASVYSHLWGFIPATFLGQRLAIEAPLLGFRVATLLRILCLGIVGWSSRRDILGGRRISLLVAGCLTLFLAYDLNMGARQGFWVTPWGLRHSMTQTYTSSKLTLYLSKKIPRERATAVVNEHLASITEIDGRLGCRPSRPIEAFVYANDAEQNRKTGAHYAFAQPFLGRLHTRADDVEKEATAHELVHVLAAPCAGWLGVSARYGAWIQTGLVEGLAEALTQDGPRQDERARLAQHKDPDARFSQMRSAWQFYAYPLHVSYPVCGSFVRFLIDVYGMPTLRCLYAWNDFLLCAGKPLSTLEREWSKRLAGPIPNTKQAFHALPVRSFQEESQIFIAQSGMVVAECGRSNGNQ
jgi:hypothetical protein